MTEKKLPLQKGIITSYNINSSLCAISRQESDSEEWLANNFIQIHYEEEYDCFHYMGNHILQYSCPFIRHEEVGRELIRLKWDNDLASTLIDMIDLDKYIYLYVDFFYLHTTSRVEVPGYFHEILIYGYDIARNVFCCANNDNTGVYSFFEIPIKTIVEAYWAMPDSEWHPYLELFSYRKPEGDYLRINVAQILNSSQDYLKSRYPAVFAFKRTYISGLDSLRFESRRIKEEEILDRRAYHLFYEHKLLMIKRIETMNKFGLLCHNQVHASHYSELVREYLLLRNLAIKYNVSGNSAVATRISKKLEELIVKEEAYMTAFIDDIVVAV